MMTKETRSNGKKKKKKRWEKKRKIKKQRNLNSFWRVFFFGDQKLTRVMGVDYGIYNVCIRVW